MSTVSPSQSNAGDLITAGAINNPINQIAAVLNGGIDNNNVSPSAGIDPAKLSGGTTTMLSAWISYAPIWTATSNPSIGNGSLLGKYQQIGKTIIYTVSIVAGTSTNFGSGEWAFSLPVTAKDTNATGSFWALRTNSAYYAGSTTLSDTTKVRLYVNGQGTAVTNSAPATWANVDTIKFSIMYEAA